MLFNQLIAFLTFLGLAIAQSSVSSEEVVYVTVRNTVYSTQIATVTATGIPPASAVEQYSTAASAIYTSIHTSVPSDNGIASPTGSYGSGNGNSNMNSTTPGNSTIPSLTPHQPQNAAAGYKVSTALALVVIAAAVVGF
ncbi:hypothetical protein BZA77DRAFT_306603 [Pyronema omphalodes]|nr:hypothetical protein BZA77DRAFT_306603 [Pyronema omphalodes]